MLAALDGRTTIYMKTTYPVAEIQRIGNNKYNVTLMRHNSYVGRLISVETGGSLSRRCV